MAAIPKYQFTSRHGVALLDSLCTATSDDATQLHRAGAVRGSLQGAVSDTSKRGVKVFSWVHYPGVLSPGKRAMRESVFWTVALCVILSGIVYTLSVTARDVPAQELQQSNDGSTEEDASSGNDSEDGENSGSDKKKSHSIGGPSEGSTTRKRSAL